MCFGADRGWALGLRQIAGELRAWGILTPRGSQWTAMAVRRAAVRSWRAGGATAEADARFLEMCAPPGEPVIIATHSDTSSDKVRHAFGRNHLSDQKQQIRPLIKGALETSGLPRFQRGKTFRVENVNFSLAAQNL